MSEVEYLAHYGVKGMRWGVRKKDRGSSDSGPKSEDASRARAHQSTVKKGGTDALSNKELQELVNRLNLEQQYSRLNSETTSTGKRLVTGLVKGSGKLGQSLVKELAKEYAKKGAKAGGKFLLEVIKERRNSE